MGFFYWGEKNRGKHGKAKTKRGGGRWRTLSPYSVRPSHGLDNTKDNREAVARYERDPNGHSFDGGEVRAKRGPWGALVLLDGHHRRQAAINRGRDLRVWVED